VFVTGNKGKLAEVHQILSRHVPVLNNVVLDLPELQGEPEDIAVQKCRIAAQEVKGPVIVEDTSLCYNALGGLPGPYIKWFLDKIGHEGLNNLLAAYEDKSAVALCVFAFCQGPNHSPITFVGRCPGKIVAARGPPNFGWDPIFQPDGSNKTFAEMTKEEKNAISHRSLSLGMLKTFFASHPEVLYS